MCPADLSNFIPLLLVAHLSFNPVLYKNAVFDLIGFF